VGAIKKWKPANKPLTQKEIHLMYGKSGNFNRENQLKQAKRPMFSFH
jgi:uncharacterized protein YneF (UPF0154 family)